MTAGGVQRTSKYGPEFGHKISGSWEVEFAEVSSSGKVQEASHLDPSLGQIRIGWKCASSQRESGGLQSLSGYAAPYIRLCRLTVKQSTFGVAGTNRDRQVRLRQGTTIGGRRH